MLLRLRLLPRSRATRRRCPPGTCTTTTTPWPPTPSTRRRTRATSLTPSCSCCCPWRCWSASLPSSPSSVSNTLYLYFTFTFIFPSLLLPWGGCWVAKTLNCRHPICYLLFPFPAISVTYSFMILIYHLYSLQFNSPLKCLHFRRIVQSVREVFWRQLQLEAEWSVRILGPAAGNIIISTQISTQTTDIYTVIYTDIYSSGLLLCWRMFRSTFNYTQFILRMHLLMNHHPTAATRLLLRASNEGSRRLHNHREGSY